MKPPAYSGMMTYISFLRRSSAAVDAAMLESGPVVVMGRGHSGTRVLAWMCTHLGIRLGTSAPHVTGDPDDLRFTNRIKRLAARSLAITSTSAVRDADLRQFRDAAAEYFEGLGAPGGPWGWKFPETYLIAPYVARLFPRARYVHLVRDGRDLAFKQHLTDDPRKRVGQAVLSACGALHLPHHLQAASSWAYQVDRFDAFRHELPRSSVLDVRFEDLCTSPKKWARTLSAFLELPLTDACREYAERGVDASKVAQYRLEDPRLVSEVERRIGGTLRRYRYVA